MVCASGGWHIGDFLVDRPGPFLMQWDPLISRHAIGQS